jgi:vacuolar protein sorting-associated protein 26
LEGADKRKQIEVRNEEGRKEKLLLYYDGETVKGKVSGKFALRFK